MTRARREALIGAALSVCSMTWMAFALVDAHRSIEREKSAHEATLSLCAGEMTAWMENAENASCATTCVEGELTDGCIGERDALRANLQDLCDRLAPYRPLECGGEL